MKSIQLTQGYSTMIDDADYAACVAAGPWQAIVVRKRDGSINSVYAAHERKPTDGGRLDLQNFIMGFSQPHLGIRVDHILSDTLDNRRSNLRIVTHQNNICNQRLHINNTSGLKGVTWDKRRGLWVAQIMHDGAHIYLGQFDDKWLAAHAYDVAAVTLFGVHAMTNDALGLLAETDISSIRTNYHEPQGRKPQRLGSSNTSGLFGVCWDKTQKRWLAQITRGGVKIHLGGFHDKFAAKTAYDLAALVFAQVLEAA